MAQSERKIAVVLIHGIGEQRPLDTLRSFVKAVIDPDPKNKDAPQFWSKPDAVSGSFDMRRFSCSAGFREGQRHAPIDFYEYYWAHKMADNSLAHTYQWLTVLLLRLPANVPSALKPLWYAAWTLLLAFATTIALAASWQPVGTLATLLALAGALAKVAQSLALRDYLGDAARYFSAQPPNIAAREEVRRGGVDLLRKLHSSGDYFRIIVVGHSLGSAIALDIIYHFWTAARKDHGRPDRPRDAAVQELDRMLKEAAKDDPDSESNLEIKSFRDLQTRIWREQIENGMNWRISDLVTLGSPLTHFPYLIGLDESEFVERKIQREFPRCPPVLDGKGILYNEDYNSVAGEKRTFRLLHHAACFAPCRWTNLYFPHQGLVGGDPIGGPLGKPSKPAQTESRFGTGILDIPVRTHRRRGKFNHTDYWASDPRDAGVPDSPLEVLRRTLAFGEAIRTTRKPGPNTPTPSVQPTGTV